MFIESVKAQVRTPIYNRIASLTRKSSSSNSFIERLKDIYIEKEKKRIRRQ